MANEYKVRVFNTSGSLISEITDFLQLAYTKKVCAPGIMTMALSGEHLAVSSIAKMYQFEVWRRPEGQSWNRDYVGICKKPEWSYKEMPTVIYTAPGLMSMLAWRTVAWYANTPDRSKFVNWYAEDAMKDLVYYNAVTAYATMANGRLREGAITGLGVENVWGHGNVIDWFCAYDNLLASLQGISLIGGGDFDLVKTSPTTYEFRFYTGQLGTDRSATLVFALGMGNMAQPVYTDDAIAEQTVAIIGGKGQDDLRAIAVRTGPNYNVTLNNIEMFANATNVDTADGLNDAGDEKLEKSKSIVTFDFEVLQTPSCVYGVHYILGDLVRAINPFTDISAKYKVQEVTVVVDKNGLDKIDVKFQYKAAYP